MTSVMHSDCQHLKIDESCLTLSSTESSEVTLLTQNVQCIGCPLFKVWSGNPAGDNQIRTNATWPTMIEVRSQDHQAQICNMTFHFKEFGYYDLNVLECTMKEAVTPVNILSPLIYTLVALVGLGLMCGIIRRIYRSRRFRFGWMYLRFGVVEEVQEDLSATPNRIRHEDSIIENSQPSRPRTPRVKSLDVFRGISIAVMIFVNYGGGGYWFFKHARWNGLTVADLVFPWFMWIMGTSMVFALQSQLRRGLQKRVIVGKILKRSSILFVLGLVLNSH